MTGYPWSQGDLLLANDLNAAIANAGSESGGAVNVLAYGADPTGVADSTAAIAAAIATGHNVYIPRGNYIIRNQLTLNNGQELYGDGRGLTTLMIDQSFSTTATGVISLTGREQLSPCVRDMAIKFAQPSDQASRANFKALAAGGTSGLGGTGIMYPPAIIITSSNRFRLYRLRISLAWDGITNAAGNTIGGFYIRDIEMCALNCGLYLDNTFDFGHISGWHHWAFDVSLTMLNGVYYDGGVFGAKFGVTGELDGVNVVDFNCWRARLSIANSRTWMMFSNLQMDGVNASIEISDCQFVQISNVYFAGETSGLNTSAGGLNVAGGSVFLSNIHAVSAVNPQISITGGTTVITGGTTRSANFNNSSVVVSGGRLDMSGVALAANTGSGAWTVPLVNVTGGAISFKNNVFVNVSPGDVGGLVIAVDSGQHEVSGNFWNGWKWTPPGVAGAYGFDGYRTAYGNVLLSALAGHAANLNMTSAAGNQRNVGFMTANVLRWAVLVNAAAEPNDGSNVGTDFQVTCYNDAGSLLYIPLSITRSTGHVALNRLPLTSTYANDAAAAAAGVGVGELYRNGSAVQVRVT